MNYTTRESTFDEFGNEQITTYKNGKPILWELFYAKKYKITRSIKALTRKNSIRKGTIYRMKNVNGKFILYCGKSEFIFETWNEFEQSGLFE